MQKLGTFLIGDDPLMLWVFGTTIFTMLVYWIVGGLYTFMDLTNVPKCLRRYKIQPGTNEPVEFNRLLKVSSSSTRIPFQLNIKIYKYIIPILLHMNRLSQMF